ncbi:MAG: 30S ribosomal protein S3 [Candidatus Levybacteria bacterium GW2011_GWC2_37_7]|nr:MAG: 30S ribosomal protein S3 [Candidatus Levybacteria bacterium GW2011_GWC2_37_7]
MGQKVNPQILRLGTIYNWSSRWFDDKKYKDVLLEDFNLRKALMVKLGAAGVSEIEIERSINSLRLIINAGSGLEEIKDYLYKFLKIKKNSKTASKIDIRIEPIKEPNLDAFLVAKNISDQLVKRLPHRRVLAQTVERVMGAGAKGIRIIISGRVGGAEINRKEKMQKGTVPLSTIRERIAFASVPALTKKGYIGVKVWINKGEGK